MILVVLSLIAKYSEILIEEGKTINKDSLKAFGDIYSDHDWIYFENFYDNKFYRINILSGHLALSSIPQKFIYSS